MKKIIKSIKETNRRHCYIVNFKNYFAPVNFSFAYLYVSFKEFEKMCFDLNYCILNFQNKNEKITEYAKLIFKHVHQ